MFKAWNDMVVHDIYTHTEAVVAFGEVHCCRETRESHDANPGAPRRSEMIPAITVTTRQE
jgi:hypothetical protein